MPTVICVSCGERRHQKPDRVVEGQDFYCRKCRAEGTPPEWKCRSRTRHGEECRHWAITPHGSCFMHGGSRDAKT